MINLNDYFSELTQSEMIQVKGGFNDSQRIATKDADGDTNGSQDEDSEN